MKVALIYDFDGTLAPGNMQEYDFIPALGKKSEEFWAESEKLALANDGDTILAYMYHMLREAKNREISIRREAFAESGSKVVFFEGVESWFRRINAYARKKGIELEHYINSSGIKEMIEGTSIAKEFKKIYACSFMYDVDGVAYWPSVVVNYTTKTQFLFKINKGIESVTDNHRVNEYVPEEERPVPFRHMIYFGDGTTDIPCMRLVKQMGGHSIAVYNPSQQQPSQSLLRLIGENRVDYVMPASYEKGGELDVLVRQIIDKIYTDDRLRQLKRSIR